jgi:amino acid transporter
MALSLGVVVGAGIFVLPRYVAELLPDPRWFLLIWMGAGLFALCVALSYAELATVYPRTGGYVVYLREVYGDRMAFVYGWAALLVLYPSGIASVARAFAEAAQHLLQLGGHGGSFSVALVLGALALNLRGVEPSSRTQVVLSATKLTALVVIAAAGLLLEAAVLEPGDLIDPSRRSPGLASWFLAFVVASWCFDGFLEIVVVAGEVERPERSLWRVLVGSVVLVTVVYALYAAALSRQLGMEGIATSSSAAADLAHRILGRPGSTVVDLIIMVATASAVIAVLFSGPRIIVALAEADLFFSGAARVSRRSGAPTVAVAVMGTASLGYASIGELDELVKYFSVYTGLFSSLILVAGIWLRLRGRIPRQSRRIPLWPLPPILALVATVLGMLYVIRDQPRATIAGLVLLAVALPLARRFVRRADRVRP